MTFTCIYLIRMFKSKLKTLSFIKHNTSNTTLDIKANFTAYTADRINVTANDTANIQFMPNNFFLTLPNRTKPCLNLTKPYPVNKLTSFLT